MNLIYIDKDHSIKSMVNVSLETGLDLVKTLSGNDDHIIIGIPLESVTDDIEQWLRRAAQDAQLHLLNHGDVDESYYYATVGKGEAHD